MISIIGDVHGKYERYHKIIRQTERYPYTVQLGDFGFKYETLKNVDHNKHIIIPGNHDNYNLCYNYQHFLGDYGYKQLNNVDFFYYRGAYSIDRQYRTIGLDWWPAEQVTIESFMEARKFYEELKPKIVITHDCPEFLAAEYVGPHGRLYQNLTGWALGELYNIHQPDIWIHGHWHFSKRTYHKNTTFICIDELEIIRIDNSGVLDSNI